MEYQRLFSEKNKKNVAKSQPQKFTHHAKHQRFYIQCTVNSHYFKPEGTRIFVCDKSSLR